MFRSCIDHLIKNLELYPQDEADIVYALYRIGRLHGKFVVRIIQEVSHELEPSFNGKLGFNKVRTGALLVLAISAPVSLEQKICSIPPQIFSYAVTLLGRISSGLVDVADQHTLLAYLSQCSRFTLTSSSENFEGGLMDFGLKYNQIQLFKTSDDVSSLSTATMEPNKTKIPLHSHVKAMSCVENVVQNIVDLWPLIQLGCMNEVAQILRSWKEELRVFSRDSHQSAGVLVFALKYVHIIKLLGNAWACSFSQKNLQLKGMALENLLGKLERRLKEMLFRYAGLSRGEKSHILELMLVTYALRLLYGDTCCFEDYTNKVNFVLRSVEYLHSTGSVETSPFVTELQNVSHEIGHSEDEAVDKLDLLQNSLNRFSLKHIVLTEELKYLDAEVDVCDNDFVNPLPFIPGLPVGIPLEITLHNISSETRLWLAISLGEKSTQFVFLDLNESGGSDEMRKFKYVAPLFRTPRVKHFIVKVSIAMECSSEDQLLKHCNMPKHELVYLSKVKEVHLSMVVK